MDECERRGGALVQEVRVVGGQLRRGQHPLVDHGSGREARDHEVGAGGELGDTPDHVELALERVEAEPRRGCDEQLPHDRRRRGGRRPGLALVDGDVAPRDHALSFRRDRGVEKTFELGRPRRVAREEADRDAVRAERRQRRPDLGAEERVGQLQGHARTVAGVGVGPLRAAVLEIGERRRGAHQRLVARDAVEPRHEGDAARVVLVRRVVEADGSHRLRPFVVPLACAVCA